jgi:hypothetical protein
MAGGGSLGRGRESPLPATPYSPSGRETVAPLLIPAIDIDALTDIGRAPTSRHPLGRDE